MKSLNSVRINMERLTEIYQDGQLESRYHYDANGNIVQRNTASGKWLNEYDAEDRLTETIKNGQIESSYLYDGDGKRVWSKDYEGYPAGELKETIYIGNYFESVREDEAAGQGEAPICESPDYCTYLPMIFQMPRGISYYYADSQRIAMKDNDGVVSYLYGDQLGSVSAVADANGNLVSTTLYHPCGTTEYSHGTPALVQQKCY